MVEDNLLYYVPAALGKGSINLVSGFEKTKYLLLHNHNQRLLVRLKGEGPKFLPAPVLQEMGFSAKRADYYLGFEIKSMKPVHGIDPASLTLRSGKGRHAAYFLPLEKLIPSL